MSEHRKALEDIMRMCEGSRTYTRRTQAISNIAMVALGMTANQRHAAHVAILDRIGDQPMRQAFLARHAKYVAKVNEYRVSEGLSPLPQLDQQTDAWRGLADKPEAV